MNTKIRIQFTKIKSISSLSLTWHRFVAVQNPGLLVLVFICLGIDARAQTVIEKTLCNSNGKYVVFAHRPLKRLPFISQPRPADSFFDRNNVQLAHEHIFFCNNGRIERNVGFGPDGRFSEESFSGEYRLVNNQKYNTSIINSILGPDACYKSEVGTYGLRSNNCQDFAARVRSEYNRRMAALAPNAQEGMPSCQAAVDSVKSDLTAKGFFVPYKEALPGVDARPKVRVDKTQIRKFWFNYPEDRTDSVVFILGVVDGLWKSPKFMTSAASKIMKSCSSVGFVSFDWMLEGTAIYGYFPGGEIKEFGWPSQAGDTRQVDSSEGNIGQYKWGFHESP